jgi:F-type H+-transporting ATPase subunit b
MLAFAESIQLIPDGTLLIHIAIIISMVFLLNRLLFKPVLKTLRDREARTHGRSDEARETIRKVGENLSRYENSLRQARAEGYGILEQQQAEANGARQLKVAEVRKEVEEHLGHEKSEIQSQAEGARATLLGEAERVAAEIKAQVLRR